MASIKIFHFAAAAAAAADVAAAAAAAAIFKFWYRRSHDVVVVVVFFPLFYWRFAPLYIVVTRLFVSWRLCQIGLFPDSFDLFPCCFYHVCGLDV